MYIVASHVAYSREGEEIFGPANNICDFFSRKKEQFIFIKHCLYGQKQTEILKNGEIIKTGKFYNRNIFIRSIEEVIINIKNKDAATIFIGIDPMNGLSGVILKIFKKIDKFIYLTPDYTETRFKNIILNKVYHFIDRVCLKSADECWAVSTRIMQKRKGQGLPNFKNKLLPNSPDFNSIKRREYDGNKNLIIVSPLSEALDFEFVIKIMQSIINNYNEVKLQIVGSGAKEEYFKKMVLDNHLEDNIIFLGWRNHDEVLDILVKSFIGFALYTKNLSWNKYGDSMKAREYVACGLPVIISDIPSNADDIKEYNAGLVVSDFGEIEVERIKLFIEKCITDIDFYNHIKNNATRLGKDFDKDKILNELLGFNN